MRSKKRQKTRRLFAIIIVTIIIVAMIFTYVFSLRGFAISSAPETPPPPDYGTDWDYDDSTLPDWVEEEEEEEVLPPVLLILSHTVYLDVGQQSAIDYKTENFPEGAVLSWSSSNPNIAAVDAGGYVIAYAPGKTEISVSGEGLRSSVLVIVNELKASRITIIVEEGVAQLGPKSYEVSVSDVIRLTAKIEPEGAKVDKIVWKLGNDKVASINPNSQVCEFIAEAVGMTQVTVTADGLTDAVSFNIKESGVPVDTIWVYIRYGIIIVIVIVGLAVFFTWLSQKQKREKARKKAAQKAAAKRRREEAERRAREESERHAREESERRTRDEAVDPEIQDQRPQTEERGTLKISGAAVGASVSAPRNLEGDAPDRPVTLDDLE